MIMADILESVFKCS